MLSGVLLLLGYLTRVAGVFAILTSVGLTLSAPRDSRNVFDAGLLMALEVAVALALVFIGPGAFSCDARLFGRREIVIPRSSTPSS